MNRSRNECTHALSNIGQFLDESRRFPQNVFRDQRNCFFFDSDRMFEGDFVELAKALFGIEAGGCACLVNLDNTLEADRDDRVFFIDHSTTSDAYRALLRGTHPGQGWIYQMDRFGCTSDVGEWIIYSERRNELAVMGIRADVSGARYRAVLSQLNAVQIAEAIARPISFGFSSEALSSRWRGELIREYGSTAKLRIVPSEKEQ